MLNKVLKLAKQIIYDLGKMQPRWQSALQILQLELEIAAKLNAEEEFHSSLLQLRQLVDSAAQQEQNLLLA